MKIKNYIKSVFCFVITALVLTSIFGVSDAFAKSCQNCDKSESHNESYTTKADNSKHSKNEKDDCCDMNCHCCHHSHTVLSLNNVTSLGVSYINSAFNMLQVSEVHKFKSSPLLEPPSFS